MPLNDLLRSLLTAAGPSGVEGAPAKVWREAAGAFATVSSDVMGTSVARVAGTAGGPSLAIVGHIDEIGVIVNHVDDDGMLWFAQVGGWDPQILVGQRVQIMAQDGPVVGVVGRKPIHLLEADDRKKVVALDKLHIDIGAKDGDEARGRVRIGDVAVVSGDPVELPNDRLVSRALDDRLGAYVALETARLVSEAGGAPGDVIGVASVQEETGAAGARTTAFSLEPQVAIAVDVCHATDAPGVTPQEAGGKHGLGDGPVISRGTTIHPLVFDLLEQTARDEGIPHTVEAAGRGTYTDADEMFHARGGIPVGLVSIPLRYMHSPVELVQLADVEATARLLAAFAQRLTAETDFTR